MGGSNTSGLIPFPERFPSGIVPQVPEEKIRVKKKKEGASPPL